MHKSSSAFVKMWADILRYHQSNRDISVSYWAWESMIRRWAIDHYNASFIENRHTFELIFPDIETITEFKLRYGYG